MKKVIKGSLYNTDTARRIGGVEPAGGNTSDFNYFCETLYRSKAGKYFLHGEGHAKSRYGVWHGNTGTWGETIRAYTYAEAEQWAEENLTADEYVTEFGAPSESDSIERVNLYISAESKFLLDKMQSEQGETISQIVDDLIREAGQKQES